MEKLKLIYNILESLNNGHEPQFNDYEVDKDTFGDVVEIMQNDGLISGATVSRGGSGNKVQIVLLNTARVEVKGLNYLKENQ